MSERPKLPYGQSYKTPEEVKAEITRRGHPMPAEKEWKEDTVTSGIGVYKTREGILHYWLIGVSDEYGGR